MTTPSALLRMIDEATRYELDELRLWLLANSLAHDDLLGMVEEEQETRRALEAQEGRR